MLAYQLTANSSLDSFLDFYRQGNERREQDVRSVGLETAIFFAARTRTLDLLIASQHFPTDPMDI